MRRVREMKERVRRSFSPDGPKPTSPSPAASMTEPEGRDSRDNSSAGATEPRTEKHGLFQLVESTPAPSGSKEYPVDIIAVHGLNGDAYSTWRHEPDGTLWLKDLLPKYLPGCRVYTFGYPSKIFSQSKAQVRDYARDLIISVRDTREDSAMSNRSTIFVCHSLGGIVVKQALLIAHEDDNIYGDVLKSIIGVAFLATPHRGSGAAGPAHVFGTIVNTFMATASARVGPRPVRTDLLNHLIYDTDTLLELNTAVRNRMGNMSVVSFYENMPTPPLSTVVVTKASATLDFPGAELFPMNDANHKSICRFPGETANFKKLALALQRIGSKALDVSPVLDRASTNSSNITLNELDRTCINLLNDHDVANDMDLPPKPVPGTCQWIHHHHLFTSWLNEGRSALLWLTGDPGSGKTMLSYSVANHLGGLRTISKNVLLYLCQDKNKQTDGKAVLIGLIRQIVDRHTSMIKNYVRHFFKKHPSIVQSFPLLWRLFLKLLKDPKVSSLYVILDALDECDERSCYQLLDSIYDILADPNQPMRDAIRVKFLITSRPILQSSYTNPKKDYQSQISIGDEQFGYTEDLRTYVRERVNEISLSRQYSSDVKEYLYQTITSKADQTFLWVHMVLGSVEKMRLSSKKDFQNVIDNIPEDLKETYRRFLSAVPDAHQTDASQMLQMLIASSRPLHLDELNIAFTIESSHVTTAEVWQDRQTAIVHTVQGILGPLVRISRQHVTLIHLTVKQFLLEDITTDHGIPPALQSVNAQSSALRLATACIQYLLLDDFSIDLFPTDTALAGPGSDMPQVLDELPLSESTGNFWDDDDQMLESDFLFRDSDALNPGTCDAIMSNYAFYCYASLHWAEHFSLCEETAPDDLRDAVTSLFDVNTANCRNWIRFYRTRAANSPDDAFLAQDPVTLASQFNARTILNDLLSSSEPSQSIKNRSLYWASRLGHSGIVASLLGVDADPNSTELERQTALTTAAEHGNYSCIIRLLADVRTDINSPGRNGRNALSFACGNGHDTIVSALLRRSECLPDGPDNSGATPFFWAVGGEHHSILSALAKRRDVDINHRDRTGRTAVSWAAGDGMADTLIMLLKLQGCNANSKDIDGISPLSWAARNGCTSTVEVLLKSTKVDKGSVDNDKRSAVTWASAGGHCDTLIKLLRGGCPGVDMEDINGWTPLAWAIQKDAPETVQALIDKQVDLERRDHSGRTALSWAVEYGHIGVVQVLLRAGASPDAESSQGRTPISVAKQFGRHDLLRELVAHKPGAQNAVYT